MSRALLVTTACLWGGAVWAIAQAPPPLALERPALPDVAWRDWTSPVDRFVAAYLSELGVAGVPSERPRVNRAASNNEHGDRQPELVGDATFARRAYLDIWGLLPPPE